MRLLMYTKSFTWTKSAIQTWFPRHGATVPSHLIACRGDSKICLYESNYSCLSTLIARKISVNGIFVTLVDNTLVTAPELLMIYNLLIIRKNFKKKSLLCSLENNTKRRRAEHLLRVIVCAVEFTFFSTLDRENLNKKWNSNHRRRIDS